MTESEIIEAIKQAEAALLKLRAQLVLAQNSKPDAYAGLSDVELDALKQRTLADAKALPVGAERNSKRAAYSELTRSMALRAAAAEVAK